MNKIAKIAVLCGALVGFGFDMGLANANEPSKVAELVIALKPDKNPEKMLEERKRLESYLSERMKLPVKVVVPLSGSVILQGLQSGTIDVGFLGSLDMIIAQKQNTAEPMMVVELDGKTSYESYWVTLKDKPYAKVSDLKGKKIAFASKTSTSGYLIPHKNLVDQGLLPAKTDPDQFFGKGNVWYGTGYVSAVEKVLDGSAEAAAISDYVMKGNQYLTPEQKSSLKILAKQGPIPTHIIAVRSTLDTKIKTALKMALQTLNTKSNVELRDKVFNSKIVDNIPPDHLKPVLSALESTGSQLGNPQ